jgi:hypothetical protein
VDVQVDVHRVVVVEQVDLVPDEPLALALALRVPWISWPTWPVRPGGFIERPLV